MTTLPECAEGALRFAGKSLLSLVGMGLYFLKAHQVTAQTGRARGKSLCATVAHIQDDAAPEGFDQWLSETFAAAPFAVSRRSAYNYMRAALRLGLTAESSELDLHALETSNALAGKTARQLYLPEDAAKEPDAKPAKTAALPPEQLFFNFASELDEMLTPEGTYQRTLPKLPAEHLEEMERKLETALDLVREARAARKKGGK